jgi:hypothetical protein
MDLKPVLFKYNLRVVVSNSRHYFFPRDCGYSDDWLYFFGENLGCLRTDELLSMSDEELEEFAVGCSIRSMCPEC